MADLVSKIYLTISDYEALLKFAFSAGVVYGSMAFAILSSVALPLMQNAQAKSHLIERFYYLGLLSAFPIVHLFDDISYIHSLLEIVYIVVFTFFFTLYEFKKQYDLIAGGFRSVELADSKIMFHLKWSFIKRNYFYLVRKYHLKFWLVVLFVEYVSEETYGIGGLLRASMKDWNYVSALIIFGCVFLLLLFVDMLLRRLELIFVPWREYLEK